MQIHMHIDTIHIHIHIHTHKHTYTYIYTLMYYRSLFCLLRAIFFRLFA